jgi:3-phosphoshikimate 1-carboxyvinyltransferase
VRAIIRKSEIDGTVRAPPSKSYTHRAIVCALLSSGLTRISNPLICNDTLATLDASKMMGATIHSNDGLMIRGLTQLQVPESVIDCGGSGTTLRFFTALSALTQGRCTLTGDRSLQNRPVTDLLDGLKQLGVDARSVSGNGRPPVSVQSRGIGGGMVKIRGDVSSQYVSGLLFACSRGSGDTSIEITTPLESQPYISMTIQTMNDFGAKAYPSKSWAHIDVPGEQEYRGVDFTVEGDHSSAAFLLAAGALAGSVTVSYLKSDSIQGDVEMIRLLESLMTPIVVRNDSVTMSKGEIPSFEFNASNTPDMVPVLALLASQAKGVTTISNAGRLRFKESDRLSSISQELNKMGASVEKSHDDLRIRGPTPLHGAVIDPHEDHRIAMTCIIAGLIADGTTVVNNIECIRKSYPSFVSDMQSIGALIDIENKNEGEKNDILIW